jgi:hypothetical protein
MCLARDQGYVEQSCGLTVPMPLDRVLTGSYMRVGEWHETTGCKGVFRHFVSMARRGMEEEGGLNGTVQTN